MRNLNKLSLILILTVLPLILLQVTSCKEQYGNVYVHTSAYKTDVGNKKSENDVSMEVLENTPEHIVLNLYNGTNSPIFVIFDSQINKPNIYFVPYRLLCKEEGENYKDYGPEWHALPTRKQLDSRESIKFEITSVPKIDAQCQISVRYFDSLEATTLLKKAFLDEKFQKYTPEEEQIIEQAKKDVMISLLLNYSHHVVK